MPPGLWVGSGFQQAWSQSSERGGTLDSDVPGYSSGQEFDAESPTHRQTEPLFEIYMKPFWKPQSQAVAHTAMAEKESVKEMVPADLAWLLSKRERSQEGPGRLRHLHNTVSVPAAYEKREPASIASGHAHTTQQALVLLMHDGNAPSSIPSLSWIIQSVQCY